MQSCVKELSLRGLSIMLTNTVFEEFKKSYHCTAEIDTHSRGDKIGCQPLQRNIWVERIAKNYSPTDEQKHLMAWLHHILGLFSFNSVSVFNNRGCVHPRYA